MNSTYYIQRLGVYLNETLIYVSSICIKDKKYTPIFVSPSNAINDNYIKVEYENKFTLGIKKKYSDYNFKIIFDENSQKYQLFYNNMNVYILKDNENEDLLYSQDDEFLFISKICCTVNSRRFEKFF